MSSSSTTATNTEQDEYTLPKVWSPSDLGGAFGGINKPTAHVRFAKDLPRGEHALQLYSLATPNGQKVSILLEELLEAGHKDAEYDAWPIEIMKQDQFGSGFTAINPNQKIPALVDFSGPIPIPIFESGSILLQLAEKFGAFLPQRDEDPAARSAALNFLFWQMGSGPYVGNFGHYYQYAPTKMQYSIDRFTMETKRQLHVLELTLSQHPYVAGKAYTIADMAIFPWYGNLVLGRLYGQDTGTFLNAEEEYPHVIDWAKKIEARPAVQRGVLVNKTWGEPHEQLRERHAASDFENKTHEQVEHQAQ